MCFRFSVSLAVPVPALVISACFGYSFTRLASVLDVIFESMLSSFTDRGFGAASEASFGSVGNQFEGRVEDENHPKPWRAEGCANSRFSTLRFRRRFRIVFGRMFGANVDAQYVPKSSPGRSWGLLGASCVPLGGPLGGLLRTSWGPLGVSWGVFERLGAVCFS